MTSRVPDRTGEQVRVCGCPPGPSVRTPAHTSCPGLIWKSEKHGGCHRLRQPTKWKQKFPVVADEIGRLCRPTAEIFTSTSIKTFLFWLTNLPRRVCLLYDRRAVTLGWDVLREKRNQAPTGRRANVATNFNLTVRVALFWPLNSSFSEIKSVGQGPSSFSSVPSTFYS